MFDRRPEALTRSLRHAVEPRPHGEQVSLGDDRVRPHRILVLVPFAINDVRNSSEVNGLNTARFIRSDFQVDLMLTGVASVATFEIGAGQCGLTC